MIYLDTETCGLHSMPVLLQYAVDDAPPVLYDLWHEPVGRTLDLVEWVTSESVVGFNLAFDWFHLAKLYTIWSLLPRRWKPVDAVWDVAAYEHYGRDGKCIKPHAACDLMLHARKGPYQSLMAREDIRIRRVPSVLADALAVELEKRVEFDGIYFAGADPTAPRWRVYACKDPDFSDVVLKFAPKSGLKFLAQHALGIKATHFADVEIDRKHLPGELGYAPTWQAVKGGKGPFWPDVIRHHILHWSTNDKARQYAADDVTYTRQLYKHFGSPEPGDDDSTLACMVAVVRWRGFTIDVAGIKGLLAEAKGRVAKAPINVNQVRAVRAYVGECLDDVEKLLLAKTTDKAKLTEIASMKVDAEEMCCAAGCVRCSGTGRLAPGPHPAAARAQEILDVKAAVKEVELYEKLLTAGRFHASFKVVGTLSSRMAGGDGLNAQGIKHAKEVRRMFPLAWPGYVLSGGDFDSFEITLADAVYNDPGIRAILKSGQKIHAYFAMCMYPGTTYEQVLASEGSAVDMYTMGKSGVFGMIYGGDWNTLVKNFGIPEATARAAEAEFFRRFPGIPEARQRIIDAFQSMTQPAGEGTAVVWRDPAEKVVSFLGHARYFTLENKVCKALFDLARKPPKAWRDEAVKVQRRAGRVQTAAGAVASALYGAAFGIQAANTRAAANHEIQSPGATITKRVQRRIWDLQPAGVHELLVAPMNVHDEIMVPCRPHMADPVAAVVRESVESYRDRVPLIGMTWFRGLGSWAGKKGGGATGEEKISP